MIKISTPPPPRSDFQPRGRPAVSGRDAASCRGDYMSIYTSRRVFCVGLMAFVTCACGGGPAKDNSGYPAAGEARSGGRVAPLNDDSSADIVSWVDGKTVTDWPAEITKRDQAIQGYLDDDDPGRAEKYGFRRGQHPRLAWSWFRENPVGFNGVPFVLLKTILDLDPNDNNPTLRKLARIWKREPMFPVSGATGPSRPLDPIGVGPNPADDFK